MRQIIPINDRWTFVHSDVDFTDRMPDTGMPVALPHSWNAVDGHDGHEVHPPTFDWARDLEDMFSGSGPHSLYDRGSYWYFRTFATPKQPLPGGRVYIEVLAAGLCAEVFVNGQSAGTHRGGFAAFRFDITDLCHPAASDVPGTDNILAINVSNIYQTDLYPQTADFTFYGGLYRGVNLISVPDTHFDLDSYGGPGFYVTPQLLEDQSAVMALTSDITCPDPNFTVLYRVSDQNGTEVASAVRPADSTNVTLPIPDPKLWSPSDPYLYTVTADLVRRNEVYDSVSCRTGIRSIACTPDEGFFLNGASYPLRGVCRHQDRLYTGNALTREMHFEDARIIKEIGANAIRLAHYQHSQDFYDACDEMGFVVWAEIPLITIMSKDPKAHDQCLLDMRELILQNRNHPSICFWGLSNEIMLINTADSDVMVQRHEELNALAKSLDPTRLTTLASCASTPEDHPLHEVPDVEGYNHYMGWYVGTIADNGPWLDAYHAAYPHRCIAVTEYGCDAVISYHSAEPKQKDYTEEYQAHYHEELIKVFNARPWVWGSFVWNMFDFGAAGRNEAGVACRNNKGLVTIDRKIRKDSFYIYQATWTDTPMVHICGKRYAQRAGETTVIKVYSNQPSVTLSVNGQEIGTLQAEDHVFAFTVSLADGMNTVIARAGSVSDAAVLEKAAQEPAIYTKP